MNKISKLFESVLENPVLVIGEKSSTKLFFYMYGSAKTYEIYDVKDPFYSEFSGWLAERTGMSRSHSWADIVLFLSFGCEYEAFDLVKKLWNEYRTEKLQKTDKN